MGFLLKAPMAAICIASQLLAHKLRSRGRAGIHSAAHHPRPCAVAQPKLENTWPPSTISQEWAESDRKALDAFLASRPDIASLP